MEYDFSIFKNIITVNYEDRFFEKKIMNLFLKKASLIYILKEKKYFGTITYERYENTKYDAYSSISIHYPLIYSEINENEQLNEILSKNNKILYIPVCDKSNSLIYEYKKNGIEIDPLTINIKRWNNLYNNNNKIINFFEYKNINKLVVIGKMKSSFKKYIECNSKIKCSTLSENIDKLLIKVSNDTFIIDTDNLNSKLIKYILSYNLKFQNKRANYLSINELCDKAELYHFTNFIKTKKVQAFFFLCQTPEQLNNLNFEEKLRISFDKHYRYYFENMNKDENINLVVKKVLKELYSSEFILSRDNMSGTILKDGICYLAPSNNKFCKTIKGLRYTTDHNYDAKNKLNMFGPCLFFGPLQDDERTIPSYIQRIINKNQKDYYVNNYGQRAISMYENLRTCFSVETYKNDILVFAISPEEKEKLNEYGITDIYSIADLFNGEPNFHDYFIGEPVHCNHIANEKIAKYIYSKIESSLINIGNELNKNEIVIKQKENSTFKNNKELKEYLKDLRKNCDNNLGITGAVMMNCNPFTKGHYNLIKYASEKVDKLFVFVVQEDKSYFSFEDRINMVKEGCKQFNNVVVMGSGKVFGSYITFPAYFHRDENSNIEIDVSMDIELFTQYIASTLKITKRFIGEEPTDIVTKNYNNQLKRELPKCGIEVIEIPRFRDNNQEVISAKVVRKALEDGNWEKVKSLVPDSILTTLEKYKKI